MDCVIPMPLLLVLIALTMHIGSCLQTVNPANSLAPKGIQRQGGLLTLTRKDACVDSYAWFDIKTDVKRMNKNWHITVCKLEMPGYTLARLDAVEDYLINWGNRDKRQRVFFVLDGYLDSNIMLSWVPGEHQYNVEPSLSIQLVREGANNQLTRPQNILCFKRTCPPKTTTTTPTTASPSGVATRKWLPESGWFGSSNNGQLVQHSTSWTQSVTFYQTVIGILSCLLVVMTMVVVVLLIHRCRREDSVEEEEKVAASVMVCASTRAATPLPPTYGNISRRKHLLAQSQPTSRYTGSCSDGTVKLISPNGSLATHTSIQNSNYTG